MQNIFHESSYDDLDLFREQTGPLQMDILQLEKGRFNAAQQILDFGDISFCLTYYALRLTTRIEMASGHVTLALPFTEASWCGEYFPQHCAAVVLPNHQSTTVLASNFFGLDVDTTEELAYKQRFLPEQWLHAPPSPLRAVLPTSRIAAKELCLWVRALCYLLKNTLPDPTLIAALRERGIELVQKALNVPSNTSQFSEPVNDCPGLVFSAQRLIDKHYHHPITVESLAEELGVSERWLQISFKKILGVSPYRYILLARLHGARRELAKNSSIGNAVTEAALQNGFSNLGRFSQQYRALFGELPNETLKLNKGPKMR